MVIGEPNVLQPRTSGSPVLRMLLAAGFVSWVACATFVVPGLIERAYRGESAPALNGIIQGRADHPVEYYLTKWRRTALQVTVIALAGVLLGVAAGTRTFFRTFVGDATPETLGAIRVVTCACLLLATSWEDLGSIALLPASMRNQAGSIGLLYALPIGFDRFVASAAALRSLQHATELFLLLGMVGVLTRVVVPAAAVTHFLGLGILVDYSFFWHQNLVPLYLLVVLSFTPCGDGLSVDRLWKRYTGRAVRERAPAVYGWSRYLCWLVIVLPYVQSGLAKVRMAGWSWWNPINMRSMLYLDSLAPREYPWRLALSLASAPDALFTVLGIATIVLEVSYILVLFSRTARRVLPVLMVGVHLGILLLQRILFIDLILLQLVFVDFDRVRDALDARLGRRQRTSEDAAVERAPFRARRRFAAAVAVFVAVSSVFWLQRYEFYPLSAWYLYAMLDTSGKVSYNKVIGHYDSGRVAPVRLEDGIGALALDARYSAVLDRCFGGPADVAVCKQYLAANGSAYNARRLSADRLTQYEIQGWTWDFLSNPADADYGSLDKRFIADLRAPGAGDLDVRARSTDQR